MDGASSAIHNYHGICNVGVGQPYQDFIHQLRTIAESGDTNRLVTVLRRADERSRDIYDVWLGDALPDYHGAYRKSIDEILKSAQNRGQVPANNKLTDETKAQDTTE